MPALQLPVSLWLSLGSAQPSGEEEDGWGGTGRYLPREHLHPMGRDVRTSCCGQCVQLIKWKNTASDLGMEAAFCRLEKTMVLFSMLFRDVTGDVCESWGRS